MDSDQILKAELQKALSECERLRDENAQLRLRIDQPKDFVSPKPKQVGAIVPEVEKLFESPEDRRLRLIRADEEQRLRRIRAGVVTAASGLGAVLLFLLLSLAKSDALFLIGPSLIVLLVGVGIVVNGLVFTVAKQSALNRPADGHQRDTLDLPPAKVRVEVPSPLEPSLPRPSVTEQTTRHLSSELQILPSRNQE